MQLVKACSVLILASVGYSAYSSEHIDMKISESPDSAGFYEVVLSGSSFGGGPNIIVYDDFSGNQVGEVVALNSAYIGRWDSYGIWAGRPEVVEFQGSNMFRMRDFGHRLTSGHRMAQLETAFEKQTEIFFSFSAALGKESTFAGAAEEEQFPEVSSWKFTWLLDGEGGTAMGSEGLFDLCIPTQVGNGRFAIAGNDGTFGGVVESKTAWSWTSKNHFAFSLKSGSVDVSTPFEYMYYRHVGMANKGFELKRGGDDLRLNEGTTKTFDRLRFNGWWGNGNNDNFDAFMGDIYVAVGENSMARVEISDSKSVEGATVIKPLPIISWSDTEIVARVQRNYIERGSSYYVKVFDGENNSTLLSKKTYCRSCPIMR